MAEKKIITIGKGDFAIMVDLILAFFKGGGLAVAGAEELIEPILAGIHMFPENQRVNIRESHHPGAAYDVQSYVGRKQGYLHISEINAGKVILAPHAAFTMEELRAATIRHTFQQIMLWNQHGVEGTQETLMHPRLRLIRFLFEVIKGQDRLIHSYSPLFDDLMRPTGLADKLRSLRARRTFGFGLADDFCAGLFALHSAWEGFESYLITDWCRSIDLPGTNGGPGTVEAMNRKLDEAGVIRITSDQLRAA